MMMNSEIEFRPFFENGLRCSEHVDPATGASLHGASCAVDSLLEIFRIMFSFMNPDEKSELKSNHILSHLLDICDELKTEQPSCRIRDRIWDQLVKCLPESYGHRGQGIDKIASSFEYFGKETKNMFKVALDGLYVCQHCQYEGRCHLECSALPFYERLANEKHPNDFENGLKESIIMSLRSEFRSRVCINCSTKLYQIEGFVTMPKFLMVNIPIVDDVNPQKPPIVISEGVDSLYNTSYTLIGAVQKLPQHFLSIVKSDNSFVVIDGMEDALSHFPSFDAAFSRNLESVIKRALHIAVYVRDGGVSYEDVKVVLTNGKRRWTDEMTENCNTSGSMAYRPCKLLKQEPVTTDLTDQLSDCTVSEGVVNGDAQSHRTDSFSTLSCSDVDSLSLTCHISPLKSSTPNSKCKLKTKIPQSEYDNVEKLSVLLDCTSPFKIPSEASFNIGGVNVPYMFKDDRMLTRCAETWQCLAIDKVIKSRGVKHYHSRIKSAFPDPSLAYITEKWKGGLRYTWVDVEAVQLIGRKFRNRSKLLFGLFEEEISHVKRNYQTNPGETVSTESAVPLKVTLRNNSPWIFSGHDKPLHKSLEYPAMKLSIIGSNVTYQTSRSPPRASMISDETHHTFNCQQSDIALKSVTISEANMDASVVKESMDNPITEGPLSSKSNDCHDNQKISNVSTKSEEPASISTEERKMEAPSMGDRQTVSVSTEFASLLTSSEHSITQAGAITCKKSRVQVGSLLKETHVHLGSVSIENKLVEVISQDGQIFVSLVMSMKLLCVDHIRKKKGWEVFHNLLCLKRMDISKCFLLNDNRKVRKYISLEALQVATQLCMKKHQLTCYKNLTCLTSKIIGLQSYLQKSKSDHEITKSASQMKSNRKKIILDYSKEFRISSEYERNLRQTLHGTKLFDKLRSLFPGVLPVPSTNDRRRQEFEFKAMMQPFEVSLGFGVNPKALLELICWEHGDLMMSNNIKVGIQSDACELAGNHSTHFSMSNKSHELFLNNKSYQDVHDVHPFLLFYGSDSRDNLEEHLIGARFPLDAFIRTAPQNVEIFLGGDQKNIQNILNGTSKLSPLSPTGYDPYLLRTVTSKTDFGPNKLRSELDFPINRKHPDSLLPSLHLLRIFIDPLHWITRSTETLLDNEYHAMVARVNAAKQMGNACSITLEQLITTFEAHVNNRGVRQGNFYVPREAPTDGKNRISLNKDHALAILAPLREENGEPCPHVLKGVVSEEEFDTGLSRLVLQTIGLNSSKMTHLQCVSFIFDGFYQMYKILSTEPQPVQKPGTPSGSRRPDDYVWGYSPDQFANFLMYKERVIQLYAIRYVKPPSPYMIMMIDHGMQLMENSIPFSRMTTESGEAKNYSNNTFYIFHTTKNGCGVNKNPLYKILYADYTRMRCRIIESCSEAVKKKFLARVTEKVQERAAVMVTRFLRKLDRYLKSRYEIGLDDAMVKTPFLQRLHHHLLAKKRLEANALPRRCLLDFPQSALNIPKKASVRSSVLTTGNPVPRMDADAPLLARQRRSLFKRQHFVLKGSAPKHGQMQVTKEALTALIEENGGVVKKDLPKNNKAATTKTYVLLVNKLNKSTTEVVRDALRCGHRVLSYSYIYTSIDDRSCPFDASLHEPEWLEDFEQKTVRRPSLRDIHFKKKYRKVNQIKIKRKNVKRLKPLKADPNVAWHYARVRRNELKKTEKFTFRESQQIFSRLCKEFPTLPDETKAKWEKSWQIIAKKKEERMYQMNHLLKYNTVTNPIYADKWFS